MSLKWQKLMRREDKARKKWLDEGFSELQTTSDITELQEEKEARCRRRVTRVPGQTGWGTRDSAASGG